MKVNAECNGNILNDMLNDMLNDIIIKKALVCPHSCVNIRSGYDKVFFLLQMSTLMSTFMSTYTSTHRSTHTSTHRSTHRSIRMNTPKMSTLIGGLEA